VILQETGFFEKTRFLKSYKEAERMKFEKLSGVFAAAVTPLNADYSLDVDAFPGLLRFLAQRGCHGAVILGTTGEGPSLSVAERQSLYAAAVRVRDDHPDFLLIAGTGTPSLDETIHLTRGAFDSGLDGVLVLPPFYFRNATEEGLALWYGEVLRRAVPVDGAVLAYHIPAVSGVGLSLDLLARLRESFPDQFAGLKNSATEPEHTQALADRFGDRITIFAGDDSLFSTALAGGAAGCITALANLYSPLLRRIWDAYQRGDSDAQAEAQAAMTTLRRQSGRYTPAPALIKALLARQHGCPRWAVRPPLLPLTPEVEADVVAEMDVI
jgi:4-hydroxy-tetrahydrodipicolinate synthase